jgi:hypothetical protein
MGMLLQPQRPGYLFRHQHQGLFAIGGALHDKTFRL